MPQDQDDGSLAGGSGPQRGCAQIHWDCTRARGLGVEQRQHQHNGNTWSRNERARVTAAGEVSLFSASCFFKIARLITSEVMSCPECPNDALQIGPIFRITSA